MYGSQADHQRLHSNSWQTHLPGVLSNIQCISLLVPLLGWLICLLYFLVNLVFPRFFCNLVLNQQVLGYEPPGRNLEVHGSFRRFGSWILTKGRCCWNMTGRDLGRLIYGCWWCFSPKTIEKMEGNLQMIGINHHINWLARLDHHQVTWFLGGKNISSRNFCSRFKPGTGQSEPQVGVCQWRERIQVLGASPDL